MNKAHILIASDHAGFNLKATILKSLDDQNITYEDFGCYDEASVDYPDYAKKLCRNLKNDQFGILICGSGVGMSIAANRFTHIRAALCFDSKIAMLAREHNDANVLVLGSRFIDTQTANNCVQVFLNTNFAEGRHKNRVKKLNQIG